MKLVGLLAGVCFGVAVPAATPAVPVDSGRISEILNENVHSRVKPVRIKLALAEPIESAVFRVTIIPEEKR